MKWNRRAVAVALIAFGALHAGRCLRCFPSADAIFDDSPVVEVDHAIHLYHGSLGSEFMRQGLASWGYDPYFMAGYPKTPIHDPSAALSDLSQWLAGGGYRPGAYKIGLLATLMTSPLLLYFGARLCGLESTAAGLGTILAGIYFWLDYPRGLLDSGLYSFLWASCWLVLLLGLSVRWHKRPCLGSWLALTLTASFALLIHPTMGVMAGPPLAVWFLLPSQSRQSAEATGWNCSANRWRWSGATVLAVAIAITVNLFWLVPLGRFWHWRAPQFNFMTAPENDPWFFAWYYVPRACVRILVAMGKAPPGATAAEPDRLWLASAAVIGFVGIGRWLWNRSFDQAGSLGLTAAWLFGLTFFGSMAPALRPIEPMRYQVPLHLLFCLAAGDAIAAVFVAVLRSKTWIPLIALCAALVVFAECVFPGGVLTARRRGADLARPFPCGLSTEMFALVDWIRANTDNSARILLEDQLRLREPTVPESSHWTPLLPILTNRQFIGGQYQCTPLKHHYAAFGDFDLGRKPIDRYSAVELAEYLKLFNVGWVICWSPKSRAVFDWFEGVERVAELPRFATPGLKPSESRYFVYRVKVRGGYFAQGNGQVVTVAPNRIELADLEPAKGLIVLRYHWFEALQTDPPLPIVRVDAAPDPVGFIGIKTDNAINRLVIETKYH